MTEETKKWVPAGTLENSPECLLSLNDLKGSTGWEGSLVYGTLARMQKDGLDVHQVYEIARETKHVDLRVVVNGYEYPAMAFVERWRREFDHAVAQEARRLVEENSKLEEKLEKVRDLLDTLECEARSAAKEAFPNADLDADLDD